MTEDDPLCDSCARFCTKNPGAVWDDFFRPRTYPGGTACKGYLAKAQPKNAWVSASARKPPAGVAVDLWAPGSGRVEGCRWAAGAWVGSGGDEIEDVTHWSRPPAPAEPPEPFQEGRPDHE